MASLAAVATAVGRTDKFAIGEFHPSDAAARTPVFQGTELNPFSIFIFKVAVQHPLRGDVSPYSRCRASCFFSRSPRLPMEGSRHSKAAPEETVSADGNNYGKKRRDLVMGRIYDECN
jgi:hypothetical protein